VDQFIMLFQEQVQMMDVLLKETLIQLMLSMNLTKQIGSLFKLIMIEIILIHYMIQEEFQFKIECIPEEMKISNNKLL
jgi:hypothetical protein